MSLTGLVKEFREFAIRGNALDLAVGVVVGAAFQKIVNSLVTDIFTPPLGVLIGGIDFKDIKLTLIRDDAGASVAALNVGMFIQTFIEFLIVAFAVFMLVKAINLLKRQSAEKAAAVPVAAPAPRPEELLLTEIRDLLKARST